MGKIILKYEGDETEIIDRIEYVLDSSISVTSLIERFRNFCIMMEYNKENQFVFHWMYF